MVLILMLLFGASGVARAVAVLDLTTLDCHNQASCDLMLSRTGADAISATFSAPDVMFGRDDFFGTVSGMVFGSPFFPRAFDLSFDSPLLWTGGTAGLSFQFSGFEVSGPGIDRVAALTQSEPGVFLLETALTFQADQSYRFEALSPSPLSLISLRDFSFLQIAQSTEPSVVPLPTGLPLLATGLIAFGWLRRRKRVLSAEA
ncbi:MAG: VPLPA-CTERM sorting domain-containing protein [Pseudomonadota bacterium]